MDMCMDVCSFYVCMDVYVCMFALLGLNPKSGMF